MEIQSGQKGKPEVQIGKTSRLTMLYDLSIFLHQGEISSVRVFAEDCVQAIDLAIDGTSIGLISAGSVPDVKKNTKVKSDILTLENGEKIVELYGRKTNEQIYSLGFKSSLGKAIYVGSLTVGDEFSYTFQDYYIRSLKLGFEDASLVYIEPVYEKMENDNVVPSTDILCNGPGVQRTKTLGKQQKNTVMFDDYEAIKGKNARITEIRIYEDKDYIKGVWVKYDCNGNLIHMGPKCPNTRECSIQLAPDEYINKIYVRSGDWLDHLSFYTNKGKVLSAGGFGGGPSVFLAPEGRKFIAIAGGFSNYMNCFSAICE